MKDKIAQLAAEAKRFGRRKWYNMMDERIDEIACIATQFAPLTEQQIAALKTVIHHYGNDPRTQCLKALIKD
jgi:hypothetical protein